MRRLAITNQKGGSGKTTTAVNLSAVLGELGHRVLVIDLDGQADATTSLGATSKGPSLYDVMVHGMDLSRVIISETSAENVHLVPASNDLYTVERALATEVGPEHILKEALEPIADDYDFIVCDCPPSFGLLMNNALTACNDALVPVAAKFLALKGLGELMHTVSKIQRRLNPELEIVAVLACEVDTRTNMATEVIQDLSRQFGSRLLETKIRRNVRLDDASSAGEPITTFDPSAPGTKDYRAAAKELLAKHFS